MPIPIKKIYLEPDSTPTNSPMYSLSSTCKYLKEKVPSSNKIDSLFKKKRYDVLI